jgi:hypothetical protein
MNTVTRFIEEHRSIALEVIVLITMCVFLAFFMSKDDKSRRTVRHTIIQYSSQGHVLNKWEHAYVRYESRGTIGFYVDNVQYSIYGPYMTKRE